MCVCGLNRHMWESYRSWTGIVEGLERDIVPNTGESNGSENGTQTGSSDLGFRTLEAEWRVKRKSPHGTQTEAGFLGVFGFRVLAKEKHTEHDMQSGVAEVPSRFRGLSKYNL